MALTLSEFGRLELCNCLALAFPLLTVISFLLPSVLSRFLQVLPVHRVVGLSELILRIGEVVLSFWWSSVSSLPVPEDRRWCSAPSGTVSPRCLYLRIRGGAQLPVGQCLLAACTC